jgi:hypothetical protein
MAAAITLRTPPSSVEATIQARIGMARVVGKRAIDPL